MLSHSLPLRLHLCGRIRQLTRRSIAQHKNGGSAEILVPQDGARSAQRLSAARVLDHSLLDGALQVGVNILVQQYSPWGGAKSRLARWAHNVIVTWLLTESHAVAGPRIGRRWFAGVRDHHRHHRTGGRPYQQFFGYLDRLDD